MKKHLLLICLISTSVFSLDLKLQCQVSKNFTFNGKLRETVSGVSLVRIVELNDGFKSIMTEGVDRNTVDNSIPRIFVDYSDNNKWDFNITTSDETYKEYRRRILIDRNVGYIRSTSYFLHHDGNLVEFNVTGMCSKVDTTQKKF